MRHLSLLALCLLLAPLPAQNGGAERPWPFGQAGGRMSFGSSPLDLYNLGILGAKAWDAALPSPSGERRSGGRQVSRASAPKGDAGPAKLRIEILYPGGPAARAGLRPGDVIAGVNGKPFREGSLAPLAKALVAAEASKKGTLNLLIERGFGDQVSREKIAVKLPTQGAQAKKQTSGKQRDFVLREALDWLAEKQSDDGSFPETLGGRTGAIVMTSMAGLAWVGGGSDARKGRHAKNVANAFKWIARYLDEPERFGGSRGGANWNQTNWAWSHAGIFFGELHAKAPSKLVRSELQRIADHLSKTQEASGGWAHGPGGPNALNYLELNMMTGLCVSALGLAKIAGCTVDDQVIEKAEAYLEASSSGGGVGYSTGKGQKGQGNIGRSAAAWLGLQNLGRGKAKFASQVKSWTARNAGDVLGGHASLMQHILLAGVAGQSLGKKASTEFWKAMERDLILARAPDGSLQPRPWHESISMSSNSDVTCGDVWTTACWATVLAADPKAKKGRGLPGWQGRIKPRKR